MSNLSNILKGSWNSSDLNEIRSECKHFVRVKNSPKGSEHLCILKMKSPTVMSITIESENREHIYSIDILTRDLLVPIYKNASLLWLRLYFGKALEGAIPFEMNFLTMEEITVNSIFLRSPSSPPSSVQEEDAAVILFAVNYEIDGKPLNVAVQIPKILEDFHEEEGEFSMVENQKLHEMLYNLEQENAKTRQQLQQSQQQILKLKAEVED